MQVRVANTKVINVADAAFSSPKIHKNRPEVRPMNIKDLFPPALPAVGVLSTLLGNQCGHGEGTKNGNRYMLVSFETHCNGTYWILFYGPLLNYIVANMWHQPEGMETKTIRDKVMSDIREMGITWSL